MERWENRLVAGSGGSGEAMLGVFSQSPTCTDQLTLALPAANLQKKVMRVTRHRHCRLDTYPLAPGLPGNKYKILDPTTYKHTSPTRRIARLWNRLLCQLQHQQRRCRCEIRAIYPMMTRSGSKPFMDIAGHTIKSSGKQC